MEELLSLTDKGRRKRFFRQRESDTSIRTNNVRTTPSLLVSYFKMMNMSTSRISRASTSRRLPLPAPVATNYKNKLALNSRQKNAMLRQKVINERNKFNRCKLRRIKPLIHTNFEPSTAKVSLLERYEIPKETKEKYSSFIRPMNDKTMKKLMRPRIYYYLEVKELRPLGRIVIQLFTEACPEVVLEFVRMCMEHNLKSLEFTRLFPMLWMEGELVFNRRTLAEPDFEYDTQVMDHGYGPGILSFPKRYCETGFKGGVINFALSFTPLEVANEDRVVFGVVTRGQNVLEALVDYGCTSGKLKKEIIVRKCGMFTW